HAQERRQHREIARVRVVERVVGVGQLVVSCGAHWRLAYGIIWSAVAKPTHCNAWAYQTRRNSMNARLAGGNGSPRRMRMPESIGRICLPSERTPTRWPRVT